MAQLWALLAKDIKLDFRQHFGLSGILLSVLASVFIVYLAFGELDGRLWVVLLWVIILFSSVNAILKSHTQEHESRQVYYYTLCDPLVVAGAKLVYNFFLTLTITLIALFLFGVITVYPVVSTPYFLLGLVLGVLGIAANFTFISKIASFAAHQNTMMTILSLPVIIPLLLPLIRLSIKSLGPLTWAMVKSDVTILAAIDLLIIALVMVLFPYLGRS